MKIPSVKVCVPRNTSYNGLPDAGSVVLGMIVFGLGFGLGKKWSSSIALIQSPLFFVIVNICLLYLVLGLGLGLGREMILATSHKVSAARSQGRPSATHQNKNAHTALLSNTINPCTSINN